MVRTAPVDELVSRSGRQQDVAGRLAGERRPDPGESIGVIRGQQPPVSDRGAERGEIPVDAPAAAAEIDKIAARREAELPASAAHDAFARGRAIEDEIDAIKIRDDLDGARDR